MTPDGTTARLASDFGALAQLKGAAARETPEAKRETAQQFEALMVQMMVKAMRQTVGKGLLDSQHGELYQEMYDQQIAGQISKNGGIGIGAMLERLWGAAPTAPMAKTQSYVMRTIPRAAASTTDDPGGAIFTDSSTAAPAPRFGTRGPELWRSPEEFIARIRPAAEAAARKIGVPSEAILAVAAHETGWGKHVAGRGDGRSSFNLFGIKATPDWQQPRVFANTFEFEGGVMERRREPFRVYHSPSESVIDFANFLKQNPRYGKALENGDNATRFIQELHKAGYATDPNYATKVNSVMERVRKMTQARAPMADNLEGKATRNG
ncbi:MAG: flagellar assembly peptidoglycan hydrolase FlgJ [Thiotrichales bacterium]